ncbi:hypothetical protein KFU94_42590 [Chloroflexi bacterium TSY]|nr:hypothetical protein [Chloroflexi bacterium TSY]
MNTSKRNEGVVREQKVCRSIQMNHNETVVQEHTPPRRAVTTNHNEGVLRNLNRTIFAIMLLVSLPLSACQFKLVKAQTNGGVPQAVRNMEGTYVGSWTMFGLDEEGQVVKVFSWIDTIKAENPQIDGEQAYVLTTGEMVFEDNNIPPVQINGKEGYFLMPDGTLGDHFIETFGQMTKVIQLSENVFVYASPVSPRELENYRLPNVSSGQHIMNKVVTNEEGMETHRITRVTTVNWTDPAGQERSTQFVSLQGVHQRQAE